MSLMIPAVGCQVVMIKGGRLESMWESGREESARGVRCNGKSARLVRVTLDMSLISLDFLYL